MYFIDNENNLVQIHGFAPEVSLEGYSRATRYVIQAAPTMQDVLDQVLKHMATDSVRHAMGDEAYSKLFQKVSYAFLYSKDGGEVGV